MNNRGTTEVQQRLYTKLRIHNTEYFISNGGQKLSQATFHNINPKYPFICSPKKVSLECEKVYLRGCLCSQVPMDIQYISCINLRQSLIHKIYSLPFNCNLQFNSFQLDIQLTETSKHSKNSWEEITQRRKTCADVFFTVGLDNNNEFNHVCYSYRESYRKS